MEKKIKVVSCLTIVLGFFLRIHELRERMGFDYDQEAAAYAVEKILSGHPTLIGQEVSVGGVFIGPAYYYLLSLFSRMFSGDPVAGGIMVALISVLTMTVLFTVTKKFYGSRTALLALFIYATSAQINFYDRTTAPSNPVMLSSLLVFALLQVIGERTVRLIPLAVFIAAAASIHFHPSAVVLLPLIPLAIRQKQLKIPRRMIGWSLIAGLIPLAPLVVFDLRHNLLNTRGLTAAFAGDGEEAYVFLFKLMQTARIQLENLAALFSVGKLGILLGAGTLATWVAVKEKPPPLLVLWLLVPPMVFGLYSGHIPEYYFLVSIPAWVIIIARTTDIFLRERWAGAAAAFMALLMTANLVTLMRSENPLGLRRKQELVQSIRESGKGQAAVRFDVDYGMDAGLRYLLHREGIPLEDSDHPATHTIVIPKERTPTRADERVFGAMKVLESPR